MSSPLPEAPRISPVPNLPQFRWNEAAKQYIGPSGRFVPRTEIRRALDQFISHTAQLMDDVSAQLLAGEVNVAQWQATMMELSKQSNLAGGAMNSGGWYQMGPEEFGRVGSKVRDEYGHIRNFASQIEDGTQKLDGTLRRRARLYGEQGRATYYDHSRVTARGDGFDLESSVLTPADHCDECLGEASRGFVPIGDLTPIGDRECRSNCQCFMRYKNSVTGEERVA